MGRVLAAGTSTMFFTIALLSFLAGGDRIAGAAALAGLVALSFAILLHVNDQARR